MAWVEQRRNGWIVLWRENGRRLSRYFPKEYWARAFASEMNSIPAAKARKVLELVGRHVPGSVGPPFEVWLRTIIDADHELGQGTVEGYDSVIRNHIAGT